MYAIYFANCIIFLIGLSEQKIFPGAGYSSTSIINANIKYVLNEGIHKLRERLTSSITA